MDFIGLTRSQSAYEVTILVLIVVFIISYSLLYVAYRQLKKDIHFLNRNLSTHFLKEGEFIMFVDDRNQMQLRNPRNDYSKGYYHLLSLCIDKKNVKQTKS